MLSIDHLVVAASDLASGARWLEERLGVTLAPGGRHQAMGTHNRLLHLEGGAGPGLYLELIAIDPAASPPGRPRWFALDTPAMHERLAQRPRLIHWVARSDSPETLTALGGAVLPMQRGDYRWQIAVTADGGLPGDGLLPTLIHWQCPMHPAQALPPSGCRLMKLEGFHPRPDALREALHPLDLAHCIGLYREDGEAPALLAYLETPRGLVELD